MAKKCISRASEENQQHDKDYIKRKQTLNEKKIWTNEKTHDFRNSKGNVSRKHKVNNGQN
jgi:hypothetical protein